MYRFSNYSLGVKDMLFVKTDELKVGMRLAKPIYNKMGVLLYERETPLTQQGIVSIKNFGLIGIYILEPAEPAPPLTQDELDFERFQTIYMFRLKDQMRAIVNGKKPEELNSLVQAILKHYGNLDTKMTFTQNLRSSADYYFKHCLNVAILSAMIGSRLNLDYTQQVAVVTAGLLHDIGMLNIPSEVAEKNVRTYTSPDVQLINSHMQNGYRILKPDINEFGLSDMTLRVLQQVTKEFYHPRFPSAEKLKFSLCSKILLAANEYDTLTAMSLGQEPMSEIAAIRFLREFSNFYDPTVVKALTDCIYIVPRGCCVELSNGEKAMVVEENLKNFMRPVVLLFSTNKLCDLTSPEYAGRLEIVDIMKTMDNRIKIDEETLKHFHADEHLQQTMAKIRAKQAYYAERDKMQS